ncbi:MAG: T9SS type A sorting domain-containing protein [Bacteroidota bacterium]|nr:T9SS type A sorting domain-containing protein [Bacteroidota bacterium]
MKTSTTLTPYYKATLFGKVFLLIFSFVVFSKASIAQTYTPAIGDYVSTTATGLTLNGTTGWARITALNPEATTIVDVVAPDPVTANPSNRRYFLRHGLIVTATRNLLSNITFIVTTGGSITMNIPSNGGATFNLTVNGTFVSQVEVATVVQGGGSLNGTNIPTFVMATGSRLITNNTTGIQGGANSIFGANVTTNNAATRFTYTQNIGVNIELINTVNQTLNSPQASIGELRLAGGGTKSGLNATQTITGNLTIESGVTLTAPTTLNIAGNFTNNGTLTQGSNTVVFNGTAAQTIAGNNATTFHNLTISNTTTGVNATQNLTVNGALNLGNNPNGNRGILELVTSYTGYAQSKYSTNDGINILPVGQFNTVSADNTNSANNLDSKVLTMGLGSSTAGTGDVTGKIRRTHTFANNNAYSYGNPNTTIAFQQVGSSTFPTQVTVVVTRGTNGLHADKNNAVQRLYQVLKIEPASPVPGTLVTLQLAYNDAGLNGNTNEENLVLWDHHIPYSGITPHEHGKTSSNSTSNFVQLSGHGLGYLATEGDPNFTKYWMISTRETIVPTWLGAAGGAASGDWTAIANWSTGIVPTSSTNIIIPNSLNTPHNPILPGSVSLNSLEIQNGGLLDGGSSTITLNGAPGVSGGTGTWINNGTFNPNTSTVIFNNIGATISGSTNFNNITITDGTALALQSNSIVNVNGAISHGITGTGNITLAASSTLGINGSLTRSSGTINAALPTARISFGGSSNFSIPSGLFTGTPATIGILYVNKTNTSSNTVTLNNAYNVTNTIIGAGKIDRNGQDLQSTNCTNVIPNTTLFNTGGGGTFTCGPAVISGGTFSELEINDAEVSITENVTVTDLKLNPGKKLAIGSGKKLKITGTLSGTGEISGGTEADIEVSSTSTTNTVYFDQTSANSKSLKNFTVSGGGTVTIGNTVRVVGTTDVSGGSTILTGGNLVIPHEGRIDNLSDNGGGTITGAVTAELFIPGNRAFRTIANPFSTNLTLADLTDDIDITGNQDNGNGVGFATTILNNPSAFWLQSDVAGASVWRAFTAENPSTNTNNLWKAGQGIRVLVRGTPNQGLDGIPYTPSDVTIDVTGTMNDKITSTPISIPVVNALNTGLWAAVSNPYMSAIEFNTTEITQNNIAASGYLLWEPNSGTPGNKGAYVNKVFSEFTSIPKFATVFVRKASAGSASTLTFTENAKRLSAGITLFKSGTKLKNSLRINALLDTFNLDLLTLIFDENFKNEYDVNEDLDKFANTGFNIFTTTEGKNLAIERRKLITDAQTLPLNTIFAEGGNYKFDFTQSDLPKELDFILVDKFTEKEIAITEATLYNYSVDLNNAESKSRYRFSIEVSGKSTGLGSARGLNSVLYQVYPNPFNEQLQISVIGKQKGATKYEIYSQMGSKILEGEIAAGTSECSVSTGNLASGVYYLSISNADNKLVKKIVK